MDAAAIFALLEKGLTLLPTLLSAGVAVEQIIENMIGLSKDAQTGTVTQDQLDTLEAQLDAAIAQFNTDLSPETPAV